MLRKKLIFNFYFKVYDLKFFLFSYKTPKRVGVFVFFCGCGGWGAGKGKVPAAPGGFFFLWVWWVVGGKEKAKGKVPAAPGGVGEGEGSSWGSVGRRDRLGEEIAKVFWRTVTVTANDERRRCDGDDRGWLSN